MVKVKRARGYSARSFIKRAKCAILFVDFSLTWGYSSVGRALRSHRRGGGFESPYLHQRGRYLELPDIPNKTGRVESFQ